MAKAIATKKQVRDYDHLTTLSLVLYHAEAERLKDLVEHAKEKAIAEGRKPPNKSDLVRLALKKLKEDDVEMQGLSTPMKRYMLTENQMTFCSYKYAGTGRAFHLLNLRLDIEKMVGRKWEVWRLSARPGFSQIIRARLGRRSIYLYKRYFNA